MLEFILFAGGVAVVAFLLQQIYRLRARVAHAETLLREAREALGTLERQVDRDFFALKKELERRSGATIFTPETPVQDALKFHPKAAKAFTKHRRTGIIRIDWEGNETIREACQRYDIDEEGLLKELNALQ